MNQGENMDKDLVPGESLDRKIYEEVLGYARGRSSLGIPRYSSGIMANQEVKHWLFDHHPSLQISRSRDSTWNAKMRLAEYASEYVLVGQTFEHLICLAAYWVFSRLPVRGETESVASGYDYLSAIYEECSSEEKSAPGPVVDPHERCDQVIQDHLRRIEDLQSEVQSFKDDRKYWKNQSSEYLESIKAYATEIETLKYELAKVTEERDFFQKDREYFRNQGVDTAQKYVDLEDAFKSMEERRDFWKAKSAEYVRCINWYVGEIENLAAALGKRFP